MIRLLDGPLAGQTLQLLRSPLYLRVCSSTNRVRGLAGLRDLPEDFEQVHVYRLVETNEFGSRAVAPGRTWAWADYRVCEVQPPSEVTRQLELWRAWCVMMRFNEKAPRDRG